MATKVKPSRLQVSWTPQAWQVPVYVNEDCFQWCDTGWCAQWWCITWTLCDQTDLQWALDCKANACDIPTDNSQLANGCWYTTCTWTVVASDLTPYAKTCDLPDFTCYQMKSCMVCNLTSPDNNHYPSAKAVADALSCAGTWDMLKSVYDPNNCEADVFNYNNMYNKLTAGSGINITANAISTASNFGTSSTAAATAQKEVSIPWITTLAAWQVVHILPSTTSTVANSTLKVNNFTAYPMRYNNAAITTSTDSIVRPANIVTSFVFDWTYWQFIGHGLDSNTTYSNMSVAEATTWTCASWRSIAACTLKCAIQTHAPISWSAYGSWWDGSTSAPTQNAIYDKVSTIDAVIPSAATSSNQLADKNYVDDSINSVTAYYITKNAAGDQWATYAELAAATTFYSWWVVRVPTRNDYTVVLDDETHSHATTRYSYQGSWWQYQYTINESPMTQAQLDALNSWITAAKVSAYDAIPIITDNCQIANGCWYTTCTGTLVASDLTPYAKTCDLPDMSCYQTKACMVCNLTSPDNNHYPTAKAVADAMACAGTGDMLKSVYDPCGCNKDAFNYCYLYNRPTIPTDNCQLANWCGYTTCTGTVSTCADVISALWYTPYSTGNPCNYINNFAGVVSALWYTPYNATNPCWYTTCTWTLVASDLTPYAQTCILCAVSTSWKYCDLTWTPTIPTDNCQLSNWCWYTTCTWTISTCSQIISTLWYTPYNSTNPNWYTTCTWTLTSWSLVTINWCCLVGSGDITIWWWTFDWTPYTQAEYNALQSSKNTDWIWRVIYQ